MASEQLSVFSDQFSVQAEAQRRSLGDGGSNHHLKN
jgi:hypothetical protein